MDSLSYRPTVKKTSHSKLPATTKTPRSLSQILYCKTRI
uniref:Uncharacterized protein n=1 Tax=Anguilla anguilla TaxID=7936 RepID=A0A0E9PRW6_ANGAN